MKLVGLKLCGLLGMLLVGVGDRACRLGGGAGRFLRLWRWRGVGEMMIGVGKFAWKSFSLVVEGDIQSTWFGFWFVF